MRFSRASSMRISGTPCSTCRTCVVGPVPRIGTRSFMADVSDPANPIITTATSATVVNDSTQELLMRLRDGSRHETVAGQPQQYNISTFEKTDLPLSLSPQSEMHLGRMDTAIYALPMSALRRTHARPGWKTIPSRTAHTFLLSGCVPRSHAGWSSAGSRFAPRRQELGPRLHRSAGSALLHPLVYRDRAEPAGKTPAVSRRVDGQSAVCCRRQFSALADGKRRTRPERNRQPAVANTQAAPRR